MPIHIDGVGFSIWRHTFQMATVTSFHTEKCCHLVNERKRLPAPMQQGSVRQFLVYSTLVVSVYYMHISDVNALESAMDVLYKRSSEVMPRVLLWRDDHSDRSSPVVVANFSDDHTTSGWTEDQLNLTSVGAACHLKRARRHSWRKPIIYTTLVGEVRCVLASPGTISSWPLTSWRPARDMHYWPAYDQTKSSHEHTVLHEADLL